MEKPGEPSIKWRGQDSMGNEFSSIEDMWAKYLVDGRWYKKAEKYWEDAPCTVDGVLGGFEELDPSDVAESKELLQVLQAAGVGRARAMDCGAGIGRVTKNLLAHFFDKVDLVEGCGKLLRAAPSFVADPCLGALIEAGLQDVVPTAGAYDVIWVQWVIIYLTDDDLVRFLQRCVEGLSVNGVIVIKENVCGCEDDLDFDVDCDDSSLTRSDRIMQALFKRAGLVVIKQTRQMEWPPDMYPVFVYVLRKNPALC